MLQSLSMKEYDMKLFSSFGFTIIDEVHHISSEVFSCALFRIVTACTLGLSATMNRKDGTTYIFKHFLGEIVYKGVQEGNAGVLVRAVTYKHSDEEFNEVKRDYRGEIQHSSMISKLCSFVPRSEFIVKIVRQLMVERPQQQIMILAHNRNLLTYLHDALDKRGVSVGYYVGGMKEIELKKTELKQVVVATYSMAQEALDIRTLTTLIMATPKTDIEQAVGRILRQKHGQPLVVDIVDTHGLFQNQWRKRRQFYKKQQYTIVHYNMSNVGVEGVDEEGEVEEEEEERASGLGLGVGGGCWLLEKRSKSSS
jgi:superfamily II DNA or RNA helicase